MKMILDYVIYNLQENTFCVFPQDNEQREVTKDKINHETFCMDVVASKKKIQKPKCCIFQLWNLLLKKKFG